MKTVATNASVTRFIDGLRDDRRRECHALVDLMRRVTAKQPVMWGDNIVGFDVYRYWRANGKEFEFFRSGFSPRKQALTLYIMPGYEGYADILNRLGLHRTGKSCLYLKRLADVDINVLEELVAAGYREMNERYPPSRNSE